jgi:integrase
LKRGSKTLPAERMHMKTPHIVPLSTQAIEILELLRSITGGGNLLFRGRRRPMSNNTILVSLKRTGYGGVMTGMASAGSPAPSFMSRNTHMTISSCSSHIRPVTL